MTIVEIINKDLPNFTGICIREGAADIKKIRDFGISLAWTFNRFRAQNYSKILIAGNNESKGLYFIADIKEILTVKEAYEKYSKSSKEAFIYHEEIFGNWITGRPEGVNDNSLEERYVIIFSNPSPIKEFSSNFSFSRGSFYYIKENKEIIGEYIEVENFGKVKSANIKLNGLTVIAGVNDTGKSTVGKIMFSIVKAMSRYEQDFNENKEQIVFESIEKLYFLLRRFVDFSKNEILKDEFYPRRFFNQIQTFLNSNQHSLFGYNEQENNEQIDSFFNYKLSFLRRTIEEESDFKRLSKNLNDLKFEILKKEEKKDRITRALKKVLHSEFFSEITPKGSAKKARVTYSAGSNKILELKIEKNEIESLELNDELTFKDVVFIETPLLLQLYGLIQTSDVFFEDNLENNISRSVSKVSLHTKDLISKIENAKYSNRLFENDFKTTDLLQDISNIIEGGFFFDKEGKELFFKSIKGSGGYNIRPSNTASGIKSFGIIQLLLQADILNDKSLLIIDEPENHLHPQWQIEYAKMIIELVKNDISIMITSHSPYIIQALKFYGEKSGIESKTNYYLATNIESQSEFKDVTNDVNLIFRKLAEPLQNLVWTK